MSSICKKCDGDGGFIYDCENCKGTGTLPNGEECNDCDGNGVIDEVCPECDGEGEVDDPGGDADRAEIIYGPDR
jgi:DnaJ-class molecular chaperone